MPTHAWSVPDVREAEARAMEPLPEGALMDRAAAGLAEVVAARLDPEHGSRIVVLAGSGGNGGDALWASAKLSGRPADGYRLSSVKVEPSTVVLQGDSEALAEVPGYVETEPLALDGATGDVRLRLNLLLPEGVTSNEGDTVVATAGVTAIEGGVTVSQPLVQQGLGQALSAQTALDSVDVILSGPVPLLDSLSQDDVFVILDLTGLISGTHALNPKVVLPDGINLQGVIPELVEVVITPDNGSAPGAPPELTGENAGEPGAGVPAFAPPSPLATPAQPGTEADGGDNSSDDSGASP